MLFVDSKKFCLYKEKSVFLMMLLKLHYQPKIDRNSVQMKLVCKFIECKSDISLTPMQSRDFRRDP